ncbi:hypothetical protein [Stenotrophomonas indicatrix]|uniref:hypothetical protein n=1 Tax=Stenotrophomonas indicatrix TaxID=2045451 RepID=UPI00289EB1AC|nr:hypothetical protein [Stenotrophomonas indicatrix]
MQTSLPSTRGLRWPDSTLPWRRVYRSRPVQFPADPRQPHSGVDPIFWAATERIGSCMQASQFTRPVAIVMFLPMIGLAGWGSWFATYCMSDGCLGVFPLWPGAMAALFLQALLVLPLHAWALKRQGADAASRYVRWLVTSSIAVMVPMFAGWVYMFFK